MKKIISIMLCIGFVIAATSCAPRAENENTSSEDMSESEEAESSSENSEEEAPEEVLDSSEAENDNSSLENSEEETSDSSETEEGASSSEYTIKTREVEASSKASNPKPKPITGPEIEEVYPPSSGEPSDPSQPRSILHSTPIGAVPATILIDTTSPIARERAYITDDHIVAAFAKELQSVIPSEKKLAADTYPVEIRLEYAFNDVIQDNYAYNYKLYQENGVNYIEKDGILYQAGAGMGQWAANAVPKMPAVPQGMTAGEITGMEKAVIQKTTLASFSQRIIYKSAELEQLQNFISDAQLFVPERTFIPDYDKIISVTFSNPEDSNWYYFFGEKEDEFGIMEYEENLYYVDEGAYDIVLTMFQK